MRLGLAATGVGLAFHLTAVQGLVSRTLGPQYMTSIYHGMFMLAGIAILDVIGVLGRKSTRSRLLRAGVGMLALVLATLPWIFTSSESSGSMRIGPDYFAVGWPSAAHMAVLFAFMTWASLTLIRYCAADARQASRDGQSRLAVGIAMISIAACLGLACLAMAAVTGLAVSAGLGRYVDPRVYAVLTASIMSSEVLLAALGATWASIWDRLDSVVAMQRLSAPLRTRSTRRRLERSLPPIRRHWEWLVEAIPEVSSFPEDLRRAPATLEALMFHELRMTQEIHDGHRRIYAHLTSNDREALARRARAAGLQGPQALAVIEQSLLQLGLSRLRHHHALPVEQRLNPPPPKPTAELARDLRWAEQLLPRLHHPLEQEVRS